MRIKLIFIVLLLSFSNIGYGQPKVCSFYFGTLSAANEAAAELRYKRPGYKVEVIKIPANSEDNTCDSSVDRYFIRFDGNILDRGDTTGDAG